MIENVNRKSSKYYYLVSVVSESATVATGKNTMPVVSHPKLVFKFKAVKAHRDHLCSIV